jgi:hypothetical protein
VISELHKLFRPELIGRFDEKMVFRLLSPDTQREIALLAITENSPASASAVSISRFPTRHSSSSVGGLSRGRSGRAPQKKTAQKFIEDAIRSATP